MLEIPHLNILSKMDLIKGQIAKRELKRFLHPDSTLLDERSGDGMDVVADDGRGDPLSKDIMMRGASFQRLNKAVAGLIDSFSMVEYLRLDVGDEESVGRILSFIDDCIQFHEAQEPREPNDEVEMDEGGDE